MPKPRESDTKGKSSSRRRRRFGGSSKRKESPPRGYRGGNDPGLLAGSISTGLGTITWLWHRTTNVLSWGSVRIEGGGGWSGTNDGLRSSPAGTTSVMLVLGAATTAGAVFILRRRKRRGGGQRTPQQSPVEATKHTGGNDKRQSGTERPEEKETDHNDSGPQNPAESRPTQSRGTSPPPENKSSSRLHLGWSPRHRQTKTAAAPSAASGERRLSLYDVLTGEAPLPSSGNPGAAGSEATAAAWSKSGVGGLGCGSGGSGVVPLGGGARRASIFDRIADVVFSEEQKEQNPVDAVAVRSALGEEFRVSFREGAMGMTLSMDPDTRNAVVGKIVEQGQAYRAGVQTEDLVIGVGEQTVSSYGTVLAFMNIMGRPIELRFRKAKPPFGKGTTGGSGGEPVEAARAGDAYGGSGGGGIPAIPEGSPASSSGGVNRNETTTIRGSLDSARGEIPLSPRRPKGVKSGGGRAPISPISPRSSGRVSDLSGLGREVASSDASFSQKMEHGVVVTKYGKKGAAAQRVLYLDGESRSVAWRELDASSPSHRRSTSLTNIIKGKREVLALAHLIEVVAGDDSDPERPSEKGSALLREHCDESLLERSFALQFKERSLEMTCDSHAEMRQLVAGFRHLQKKYGQ